MVLKFIKNSNGVTIIEVLISVTIFAILFVAYMAFYSNATISSLDNQNRFVAVNLAQQEIESYKQYDLSNLTRDSAPFSNFPNTRNQDGYNITTDIIPDDELPLTIRNNSDYIPIRVTVTWNNQRVSMDTYLVRISD